MMRQGRLLLYCVMLLCYILLGSQEAYAKVETEPSWREENLKCHVCEFTELVIKTIEPIAKAIYDGLRQGAQSLLAAGFLVYLVVTIGKVMYPFSPLGQVRELFNNAVVRLGLVFIVLLFLSSFANFWELFMAIAAGTFKTVAVLMDVGESYAILGTGGKLGNTGSGTSWFS
ncbi:MAG: hypothetical protein AAFY76_21760, partial [Cyanobacteria bacterium J06649_11]